ncbi:ATP-binding protein [Acuticoccus sp. MNP-M23]|uniref:sensor histidine kinase n=1 Tax=Acuticoccus sp. MNP-M23 TaxID=3072793 RepID=UPI002815DD4B|nr:ATP-binding protein [Acuticoccus sp. MNP-M23]WMS43082.1 ATP-binding protein [Acuticoccus sp. MNP-M23]
MPTRLITIRLESDKDIPRVRQVGRAVTEVLGFATFSQTRIVTAMLELARNAIVHGGGGRVVLALVEKNHFVALLVTVSDTGPGVQHLEDVLSGVAAPSATGLGLGLRGAHRIADTFEIHSTADGTEIDVTFQSANKGNELSALVSAATDSLASLNKADPTEALVQQNRELMLALQERDLLIREVHHRTRNNLALIGSLVRLSQNAATHAETKDALSELGLRMQAILAVHEQLERAEDGKQVSILPFLRNVADRSAAAFSGTAKTINVSVEGDDLPLAAGVAVDLGLILAELMTNAMKHAFNDRDEGTVRIKVVTEPDHEMPDAFTLEVWDDGPGLPPGVERPERSNSLGWRMIRAMASRHSGRITVDSDDGFRVRIMFASAGTD